ncbi:hypothetical protein HCN44_001935 [Aphidius gifuensis]|uniref:Phospholipid/glycerol acyltransferase domain-containing protein n=1 Tax=Aphidius gifuensis TaxID=684658 RepID=A0A835CWF5_APHGI|nr:1-acyl-sn-glycerol-3-phosphate acyltransferase gamma-like [Aphidius gifuensis]XP_044021331.1 1-acyl-sn-glycerol-3-phosphate acyltransferase gamma-like [Aphidius gifuensis]KAF7996303.1 hypothetical protein HCN44_001935 [Aphidius gifuensis]
MGFVKSFKRSTVVHLMFATSFFTSGIIINVFQIILYLGVKPFSKYYYRKINYYLCYSFYSQLVFLGEWWSGSTIEIWIKEGDYEKYFGKEHGFLLMNHSYEIDWLAGWIFCDRIQVLGNCKTYAKKSIQYIPTLGWAWKFAESIFLERNWDKDKDIIRRQIKELADHPDPIWLLLFAEGTRFTPKKHEVSEKFAKEKGLPALKHHLTPRTKGFTESLPHLRGKNAGVYNIQVAFDPNATVKPTISNLLNGEKVRAVFYMKRMSISEVPEDEEGAAAWLHKQYEEKDRIAESFNKTGDFFATSGVERTKLYKPKRRYFSFINTLSWAVVTLIPMSYSFTQLVLSGSTLYVSIAIGVASFFYVMMRKVIAMSEVSKTSSSYGTGKKTD